MSKTINQKINEEITAKLVAMPYDLSGIYANITPGRFSALLYYGLSLDRETDLGCDWPTMKNLIWLVRSGQQPTFNYFEVSYALNCLARRSYSEVKDVLSHEEYISFKDVIEAAMKEWQVVVEPIKMAIVRKYEVQTAISKGTNIQQLKKR